MRDMRRDTDDQVERGGDLRTIRQTLRVQAVLLDRLAVQHARARQPNWRRLLEAAHELRLFVRSLPR
jgi:hypothetical protein